MRPKHLKLLLFILIPSSSLLLLLLLIFFLFICKRRRTISQSTNKTTTSHSTPDPESATTNTAQYHKTTHLLQNHPFKEQLIRFEGAEGLQIGHILDAPGEVIGKSSYGTTLYKARLLKNPNLKKHYDNNDDDDDGLVVLRFLRPACWCWSSVGNEDAVREIGNVRHENVVPLMAFYVGNRGEKLMVCPFYGTGNLAEFIRDRKADAWKWDTIYEISVGIVKGLCHLHYGPSKQIIHGNLKSKNILLGRNLHPYLSDYGLHLLLNPAAGQEMLEVSAGQGYKAPELIKMKDVNEATDVFSLGVILLELLTGKEPINGNPSLSQEFYLPDATRTAILDRRFDDLYQPDLLISQSGHQRMITRDRLLNLVQLAITCCSPSPSLRPRSKDILQTLEEIGTS